MWVLDRMDEMDSLLCAGKRFVFGLAVVSWHFNADTCVLIDELLQRSLVFNILGFINPSSAPSFKGQSL